MNLIKKAKECFDSNPGVETLYGTSDGQFFVPANARAAKRHAAKLADDRVTVLTRKQVLGQEDATAEAGVDTGPKQPLELRLEAVEKATSLQELDALSQGEKAKTVLSAIKTRQEEISAQAEIEKLIDAINQAGTVEEVDAIVSEVTEEKVLAYAEQRIGDINNLDKEKLDKVKTEDK